jgi:hypothetical protein
MVSNVFKHIVGLVPTPLAHVLVALQNAIVRKLLFLNWKSVKIPMTRYGSSWGGWWLPNHVLCHVGDFSVISCGLGHDISFDLEMASLGMGVLGVEGNEVQLSELKMNTEVPPSIELMQAWIGDGFYNGVDIEVLCDKSIQCFGKSMFILKMDIEGSEISVLRNFCERRASIPVLMFELDYMSLVPFMNLGQRYLRFHEVKEVLNELSCLGYVLYKIENWNIHVVHLSFLEGTFPGQQ